jgi:nitrous oxidase accessory protein NosD
MVQQFRRHGAFVFESERATVDRVTSHYNCYSGIFLGLSNRNDVTGSVSVRNGIASGNSPCGGNCVSSSNDNRIRGNQYHGNGAAAPPNDFGVGLVGTSTGNVIDENSIGGNINGVFIAASAVGNRIVRNIIAGNPPVQLSFGSGVPIGADIRDFSPANANTFRDNHCITYLGMTTPPPCPSFPRSRRGRDFD